MRKADIVDDVARDTEATKTQAAMGVDAVFEAIKDHLVTGGRIELRGLGVFVVKARKRGIGRNPRTGIVVKLAPGWTVRFKPGKALEGLVPDKPCATASGAIDD